MHQARDICKRTTVARTVLLWQRAAQMIHRSTERLYYAASCTDCGCCIGVRDPHVRVSSRNERHPLRRGRVFLQQRSERVHDRFCVSTGCAFCRQVAKSYAAKPIKCLAGQKRARGGGMYESTSPWRDTYASPLCLAGCGYIVLSGNTIGGSIGVTKRRRHGAFVPIGSGSKPPLRRIYGV